MPKDFVPVTLVSEIVGVVSSILLHLAVSTCQNWEVAVGQIEDEELSILKAGKRESQDLHSYPCSVDKQSLSRYSSIPKVFSSSNQRSMPRTVSTLISIVAIMNIVTFA